MADAYERAGRRLDLFSTDGEDTDRVDLSLAVVDRDVIDELLAYPDPFERDQFALGALRIGVLALRQARGRVDADMIQRETTRMLTGLERHLAAHATTLQDKLAGSLKEYFDPQSGRFAERVQQLTKEGGELEQVLRRQIGNEDSELARTLLGHVGQGSPLMKLLSPGEKAGLLASLAETLRSQLGEQNTRVLSEFSLDNKEGALARMIGELTSSHGQLTDALQKKIDTVVAEFSLDKDDSALSRLVRNVEVAQRTITQEFSLDGEESALSRLKRELVDILDKSTKDNTAFQEEVKIALAQMVTRREEAQRGTQHGLIFEDAVCQFLEYHAQSSGDVAQRTGHSVGLIKNCKKGDCVLELGPDSAAPAARIVVEAKEEAGYSLAAARAEIEEARKNRNSQVGLFVYSCKTAPAGCEEVFRLGSDVFVVWDPENPATNLHLKVGLTLARALCIRAAQLTQSQSADFDAMSKAILEIEKQSKSLDEVTTSASTILKGAEKIQERIRISRKSLERQVEILNEHISELRRSTAIDEQG